MVTQPPSQSESDSHPDSSAQPDLTMLFGLALNEFDRRVRAVRPDQWSDPTPCSEWDVRTLVGHVVGEQLWAPPMLGGQTMGEIGDRFEGDLLGSDPVAAWAAAAEGARAAVQAPGAFDGPVHASYGDVPAERYLSEMTLDATVHGWDLARAVRADERLDERLVDFGLAIVEPNLELLAASGMFAAPVPVAPDSDRHVRLLGLLGRRA